MPNESEVQSWSDGYCAGQYELASKLERCQDDDAGDKGNIDRLNLIIHNVINGEVI